MPFLKETFRILWRSALPGFAAFVVGAIIDQTLNHRLELLLQTDEGPGSSLWVVAFLSLMNSFIFPVFAGFCVIYGLARARGLNESLLGFTQRVLNQLYIETLRSWGSVLNWGLLLILPGVVRLAQLTYVPYVVAFHRAYDEGQVGALQMSSLYSRKHPFLLSIALLVFFALLPLILTNFLDPWRSFDTSPVQALGCSFLDFVLLVLSTQVLFRLFDRTRQELGHESVLQLERHPAQG